MNRVPHIQLMIGLAAGLLASAGIGLSGSFVLFDAKGILSGPFSALLLISAVLAALFILVALDWRIWQPQRDKEKIGFDRWLAVDVLGNAAPPPPDWSTLVGKFSGFDCCIERDSFQKTVRWSMKSVSGMDVRIVRAITPPVQVSDSDSNLSAKPLELYLSGDSEFDARYLWQTEQPETFLRHLKKESCRSAIKRLVSLFARSGPLSDPAAGVVVAAGRVSLLQTPAPLAGRNAPSPVETLLVLHDLATIAAHLQNCDPLQAALEKSEPPAQANGWLVVGCIGTVAILGWLALTWLLAHWFGLPAAMIGFFMPAILLALLFMMQSASGSGREPEIEDAIASSAANIIEGNSDLQSLLKRFNQP